MDYVYGVFRSLTAPDHHPSLSREHMCSAKSDAGKKIKQVCNDDEDAVMLIKISLKLHDKICVVKANQLKLL